MKEIYLEYLQVNESKQFITVPIETYVVLFVLRYLKRTTKLAFIKAEKKTSSFFVPLTVLKNVQVTYFEKSVLCIDIKNCILPAISLEEAFYVTGLCSVLRKILKFTGEASTIGQKLLGFRGGCLTACAEVSMWTRFCEIDLLKTTNEICSDSRKSKTTSTIPSDLIRLECHLQTPVRTHNIYKRRQKLAKELKKLNKTGAETNREIQPWLKKNTNLAYFRVIENGDEVVENMIRQMSLDNSGYENDAASNVFRNDYLPQLTHLYAEGADMTLADIIFFPCIHHILIEMENQMDELLLQIPLILRWYQLMKLDENIINVMEELHMCIDVTRQIKDFDPTSITNFIDPQHNSQHDLQYAARAKNTSDETNSSFTRQHEITQILEKIERSNIEITSSTHPCDKVGLDWTALPDVVHPSYGELPNSRLIRKCQQVENLVSAILEIAKQGDTIVDFCSGGGHLGIVLAYLLPRCRVIMIDNKEESAARAYNRVQALGLTNAVLYQSNLDYFCGRFDIGTSLHACGVATDLVIQRCLDENAAFVVCPCCYGAVKNNHIITYPRSDEFKRDDISYRDYLVLSHSADQTHVNGPKTEQGKKCMEIIDTDRLLQTRRCNYKTILCTLIPSSCTPKNNLLIGLPNNHENRKR